LFGIIVIYKYFIDISQGNVKTHLRRGGICYCKVSAECASERILKIGQKLTKIWTKVKWHVFWPTTAAKAYDAFCVVNDRY